MSKIENGNNQNGNGDYDYSHNRTADLRNREIGAYRFTSKSDMAVRLTGGYADNAMDDPSTTKPNPAEVKSIKEADEDSQVDQLHDFVKGVLSDKKIVAGATLNRNGLMKAAARLGISAKEVKRLMGSLRQKLSANPEPIVIGESEDPRYSYETDGMLNVTIRDRETGDEFYYGTSQGAPLVKQLRTLDHGSPAEQALLASYADGGHRDMVAEGEEGEPHDFLAEIASPVTTFNFPWKFDGEIGTATAQCRTTRRSFVIEVVDCRDSDGEEIAIDDELEEALKEQAEDFIPEA